MGNDKGIYVDYLMKGINSLQNGGAQFIIMAANSPHAVYDELTQNAEIPILSIVEATAGNIYAELGSNGLEVLFDDRKQSPGVKFNDADLLGIPIRVTVSPRTLKSNSVEIKWRSRKESELVPLEGIVTRLKELITD